MRRESEGGLHTGWKRPKKRNEWKKNKKFRLERERESERGGGEVKDRTIRLREKARDLEKQEVSPYNRLASLTYGERRRIASFTCHLLHHFRVSMLVFRCSVPSLISHPNASSSNPSPWVCLFATVSNLSGWTGIHCFPHGYFSVIITLFLYSRTWKVVKYGQVRYFFVSNFVHFIYYKKSCKVLQSCVIADINVGV